MWYSSLAAKKLPVSGCLPASQSSGTLLLVLTNAHERILSRSGGTITATTKEDLVDRIAESTGERQSLVKRAVQQFFDEIIAELAKGNRLEFREFGVFEIKTAPPRMAQNPRTQKKVRVAAKRRVVFRAGRAVKEQLNGKTSK